MRRLLFLIFATALALATGATVLAPAAGAAADVDPARAQVDQLQPDEVRPVDDAPPRIRCRGRITDEGAPTVRCRWTATDHPDAAGYKIIRRGGMDGRTVAFATRNLDVTRFVDTDVEFKTRYRYRVVVVDADGNRLEASRWNRAAVRNPEIERLRLHCEAGTSVEVDTTSATCTWRPAKSTEAVNYELWRLVRGADHRELVATTGLDRTTVTDDDIPADAKAVVYAVLAIDDDGDIVGRSRLSRVRFHVDADAA